jgi:predicted DNA-binding transcriptional regulator AlpA
MTESTVTIPASGEDRLFLMTEVADITRMSIDTLRYLRLTGDGPPSFRLGRRVVYPQSGLRDWIRERAEQDAASREPSPAG